MSSTLLRVMDVRIIRNKRGIFCMHKFYYTQRLCFLLYALVSPSPSPILASPFILFILYFHFPIPLDRIWRYSSRLWGAVSNPQPRVRSIPQKTGLPQTHYCVSVHWMSIRATNGGEEEDRNTTYYSNFATFPACHYDPLFNFSLFVIKCSRSTICIDI